MQETRIIKKYLFNHELTCLQKCVPEYSNLNLNEIIDYEGYTQQKIITNSELTDETDSLERIRNYQHIFRKLIFENYQKCAICCTDVPELLEAAHIQPYSKCINQIENMILIMVF